VHACRRVGRRRSGREIPTVPGCWWGRSAAFLAGQGGERWWLQGCDGARILPDVGIGFGKTAEHNRALLEADWPGVASARCFWGRSREPFLEATKTEKKMKDRDEALDWWNRELLARRQAMVWRVHDPRRVAAGAGLRKAMGYRL
jgi:dihydropteroate synthase